MLILSIGSFSAGYALCRLGGDDEDHTSFNIHVVNNSGESISNLQVLHKQGSVVVNTLEKDAALTLSVIISDVVEYEIQATLDSGKVVTSSNRTNIEPGSEWTEIVGRDSIYLNTASEP